MGKTEKQLELSIKDLNNIKHPKAPQTQDNGFNQTFSNANSNIEVPIPSSQVTNSRYGSMKTSKNSRGPPPASSESSLRINPMEIDNLKPNFRIGPQSNTQKSTYK